MAIWPSFTIGSKMVWYRSISIRRRKICLTILYQPWLSMVEYSTANVFSSALFVATFTAPTLSKDSWSSTNSIA